MCQVRERMGETRYASARKRERNTVCASAQACERRKACASAQTGGRRKACASAQTRGRNVASPFPKQVAIAILGRKYGNGPAHVAACEGIVRPAGRMLKGAQTWEKALHTELSEHLP